MKRDQLKRAALLGVVAICAPAQAGLSIVSVSRSVEGTACVNAPPWTLNWCIADSASDNSVGSWFKAVSNGPSAAGEIGAATSIAQATQASSVNDSAFTASMGLYTYLEASGTCSGSTTATNSFEVKFSLSSAATLSISTTANNSGTNFQVSVSEIGGFELYSSGLTDTRDVPLSAGTYKFLVYGHHDLACSLCFSSKTANINTVASFNFGACAGDFNGDQLVDDADFSIFVVAYNDLLCPNYPESCPGDLNGDAYVDDADFSIFVVAYNELVCP